MQPNYKQGVLMQQAIIKILKNFVNLLKDIRNYYRFPRAYIAYRGVFRDFAQAQESSPNRKSQTYSDKYGVSILFLATHITKQKPTLPRV